MCGRFRHPETRWQMPPGAAGGQHEHDRCEHRPVIDSGDPTTLTTPRRLRDQRRNDLPQPIRHKPNRQPTIHKGPLSTPVNHTPTETRSKFPHLDAQLRNHGIEQADAELIWIGRPPLIPQQRAVDGLLLGEFSYHALATIEFLDIKISAVDSIGDLHQLLIHSPARLPPKAARIVNSLRMQVETDGDTPLNFSQ